jgi:hypothetical protein
MKRNKRYDDLPPELEAAWTVLLWQGRIMLFLISCATIVEFWKIIEKYL